MNKNKNKGKAYERVVAKHLSSVFELNFERVPNSGAFVGGKNIETAKKLSDEQLLLMDGDIIMPIELSHVSIECKWYKDFSWKSLFSAKGESHLNQWIEQVSETTKPFWFICFKINNCGEYVVYLDNDEYNVQANYNVYIKDGNKYIITSMINFFENNKESILKMGY